MDKAIAEIAKALKESEQSLGICLQQICDVLANHEQRLQKLEGKLSFEEGLDFLKARIMRVEDSAKRTKLLQLIDEICEMLGAKNELEDLEAEA
jgi:predicted DNA-binding protein YlxM (UPF0122 family)